VPSQTASSGEKSRQPVLGPVAAAPSSDEAGAPYASAMATGAAAPASATSTEPKQVRTVTIYPNSDTPPAVADRFMPAAPVPVSAAASPLAEHSTSLLPAANPEHGTPDGIERVIRLCLFDDAAD
jgi:hypothetical protein